MKTMTFILAATNMGELYDEAVSFLQQQGMDFGINLISAIAIFVIGKLVAKLLTKIVRRIATRAKMDDMLVNFLHNLSYSLLLAFVVLAALDKLGVNTTSLSAIIAAASLAIGFSLKDSLSNFASVVMLIIFKPFTAGDFVEAGGCSGTIEEVQIFNTLMRTSDNKQIIVPNGTITSDTITNYSAKPTRRIDLVIGCGYNDDLRAVKEYLESVISADDRILVDPEPVVAVNDLAVSSVDFIVRPWVNREDFSAVRRHLIETIKLGFDERGFHFPYPSQDVYMHKMTD